jgi:SAM-dependent methyltransferase
VGGVADSYADAHLAELYDLINTWADSDDFYLELVMSAASVLDLGCGTGTILKRARAAGHTGHLRGLDPAGAMLDLARSRTDVEWVLGDLTTVDWREQFDLIVMTGHAFQVLLTDDDIRATLSAAHRALAPGGRFAFETRNPLVRAWESWAAADGMQITTPAGAVVRIEHEILSVADGVVQLSETFTSDLWDEPQPTYGGLRFVTAGALSAFLREAGLAVDEQFGNWDRSPLTEASPEIITIARR